MNSNKRNRTDDDNKLSIGPSEPQHQQSILDNQRFARWRQMEIMRQAALIWASQGSASRKQAPPLAPNNSYFQGSLGRGEHRPQLVEYIEIPRRGVEGSSSSERATSELRMEEPRQIEKGDEDPPVNLELTLGRSELDLTLKLSEGSREREGKHKSEFSIKPK